MDIPVTDTDRHSSIITMMYRVKNIKAVKDLITRREHLRATPDTPNLGAGLPNGSVWEMIDEINQEIARIIHCDLVYRNDAF